ncbi:hypothetical protein MASR2M117_07010 [Paludibacter sp.]
MEVEKGKTAKYLRDKQGVSDKAKEQQKEFQRIKKLITNSLADGELTITEISEKTGLTRPDAMFYVMSLVKYGIVQKGEIDDMDEYYTYKLIK